MARRYFGTDGIRGRVGQHPITPEFVLKLGWAAGAVLRSEGCNRVIVGKDTRISGYMFESALESGFAAAGLDIALLGPMPTPGIAYLTRTLNACAGVVISASHNPFYDNGIKFFSREGVKLADDLESEIEARLDQDLRTVENSDLGKASRVTDARGRYIEFCKGSFPSRSSLRGLKVVVDCANGATYDIAPSVFSELGADVHAIGVRPDGLNINRDCGSTHPGALRQAVLEYQADLGIAFDGDGDRVLMVDRTGRLVDGDQLLYILARDRMATRGLDGHAVVGTQMTNLGVEVALREAGVCLHRAKVGDRYVLEMMLGKGALLGGEGSGHLICLDRTTTGDGIVSALQVLAAMQRTGQDLPDLLSDVRLYPQYLLNVATSDPARAMSAETVRLALAEAERELGDSGRVLLRPSGTEPLVRVMVEGSDDGQVKAIAGQLAAVVKASVSD